MIEIDLGPAYVDRLRIRELLDRCVKRFVITPQSADEIRKELS